MRLQGLDFLRGISVLLVLFRHSEIDCVLRKIGWVGVDLFFVLSGFLISGLIFNEYKKTKTVNIKRFLIRRGFKIYPPFYIMIGATLIFQLLFAKSVSPLPNILSELFYMQSYFPGMWNHTWSLSVEEHFYLLMALFTFLSLKFGRPDNVRHNSFLLIGFLVLNFLLRFWVSYPHKLNEAYYYFATHLRLDRILTGVLFGYFYHFTGFYRHVIRYKWDYAFICYGLLLPIFLNTEGGFLLNTIGYTLIHTGFAIITYLMLEALPLRSAILKFPFAIISFIGVHSYSIYLWYLLLKKILLNYEMSFNIYVPLYFIFTIGGGIVLSYLIEKPTLRLRDKWFA